MKEAPDLAADPAGGIELSSLDSSRFGVVVARHPHLTCADLSAAELFCEAHHVDLLIARCPVSEAHTVQCLEDDGFRWMDTLVYWRRNLAKPPTLERADTGEYTIRPLLSDDASQVATLVRATFGHYSGHYHADARLDRDTCTAVYVDWAVKSCAQPGFADVVLGVEQAREVLGFMALKDTGDHTCDIALVAVAPQAQGRGLFRTLLAEAVHWMRERAFQFAEYSCILTNIAAQTGLARAGFEVNRSVHTFHKWFDRVST